jgi:hypothetical protein
MLPNLKGGGVFHHIELVEQHEELEGKKLPFQST